MTLLTGSALGALGVLEEPHYDAETGVFTVPLVKAKTRSGHEMVDRLHAPHTDGMDARSLNLLANVESMQYVGPLHINSRQVKCIYDTGSSNTWAYSNKCSSEACKRHDLVDPGAREVKTETTVEYGSGKVVGYQVDGTVSFADCPKGCDPSCACGNSVDYIAIHTVDGQAFVYGEFNCIVGLAMPKLALGTSQLTIQSLMDNPAFKHRKFGFYLTKTANRAGSRFTFGPPDKKLYHGAMNTHSLWNANEGELSYWTLKMTKIYLRHKNDNNRIEVLDYCTNGCQAAMDTGTSLITGPPDKMDSIIKKISVDPSCVGIDKLPDIGFQFENPQVTYWLSAASYVMEDIDPDSYSGQNICMTSFQPLEMHGFSNFWIMGDTFLSSYYSVYDFSCYKNKGPCTVSLAAKSAQVLLDKSDKANLIQEQVNSLSMSNPVMQAIASRASNAIQPEPHVDAPFQHIEDGVKSGALLPSID